MLLVPIEGGTIELTALGVPGSGVRESGMRARNAFLRMNLSRLTLYEVPLGVVSVPLGRIWWEEKQRSCCRDRSMMDHALYPRAGMRRY